jgi:hypothetical protein
MIEVCDTFLSLATYDDAMDRLKLLRGQAYAYTEDGVRPESKSETVKKAYQRIKVKGNKAAAAKLMRVQPINSSSTENCASNLDCK